MRTSLDVNLIKRFHSNSVENSKNKSVIIRTVAVMEKIKSRKCLSRTEERNISQPRVYTSLLKLSTQLKTELIFHRKYREHLNSQHIAYGGENSQKKPSTFSYHYLDKWRPVNYSCLNASSRFFAFVTKNFTSLSFVPYIPDIRVCNSSLNGHKNLPSFIIYLPNSNSSRPLYFLYVSYLNRNGFHFWLEWDEKYME